MTVLNRSRSNVLKHEMLLSRLVVSLILALSAVSRLIIIIVSLKTSNDVSSFRQTHVL